MPEAKEPFNWFGKVPKSWLPFQIAVGGAWAIIIAVSIATCGESSSEREARVAAEAVEEAAATAQQEVAEKAAAAERMAKIERLGKETCTPEKEKAFMPFIGDRLGTGVLVEPLVWQQLRYTERVGFSGWVSLCLFDGEMASVKNAFTGDRMATFSIDFGYQAGEEP